MPAKNHGFTVDHHYYEVTRTTATKTLTPRGIFASVYQVKLNGELVHTRFTMYEAYQWIAGSLFTSGNTPQETKQALKEIHDNAREFSTPPTRFTDATGVTEYAQ